MKTMKEISSEPATLMKEVCSENRRRLPDQISDPWFVEFLSGIAMVDSSEMDALLEWTSVGYQWSLVV